MGEKQSLEDTHEGKEAVSATGGWAEAELRRRYGDPIVHTIKMAGFALPDARQIALQRDVVATQIWLEDDAVGNGPPAQQVLRYGAEQTRHSNLPPRLKHQPPNGTIARPVSMVTVPDQATLRAMLDWYDGRKSLDLDRTALERYRRLFTARYPDFSSFAQRRGGYFNEERAYKEALIKRCTAALLEVQDEADLGSRLLDVLTGRAGVPSGLLGWRTDARIMALRAAHPGIIERAAGRLGLAANKDLAIAEFAEVTWPLLAEGQKNKPYSESRNIPTMLAALVDPAGAYGINTDPVQQAATALMGRKAFGYNPMIAEEYATVRRMVEAIRDVMADEWGWEPRDLWDVQGFIWAVNRSSQRERDGDTAVTCSAARVAAMPVNLILYGPPGTGKTFSTAAEAIRLCDGALPDPGDRAAVRRRYAELVSAKQIHFVTFHQSYSYEEFVEGLRPLTGDDATTRDDDRAIMTGGFRLEPVAGVFREIATLAEQARKSAAEGRRRNDFNLAGRRFWKMGLGAVGSDEHVYSAAIDGGYVALGWGADVNWSDSRFESLAEMREEWAKRHPDDKTPSQTTQPWVLRNKVKRGDLVIVPYGNSAFRAVGEVDGDYYFEPSEDGTYNQRRKVQWLLTLDEPLPLDTIVEGNFTIRTLYEIPAHRIRTEALIRLISRPEETHEPMPPDQFVLIIDEINRADISKVFGELITLIEPDKRIGGDYEIRVTLPYSKMSFGVPDNVHIVGTMNTADRSIALLDTALRRRFVFRELMPQPEQLRTVDGIDLSQLLTTINERIEYLFDREHQIGHAFFMHCKDRADIDEVMRRKVIPLLAEYFYDDWNKLALVLGDTDEGEGDHEGGFLDRRQLKAPNGLEAGSDASPRYRWTVRDTFDYTKLQ